MALKLKPNAAQLAQYAAHWLDGFWDEQAGLIYFPSDYSMAEVRTPTAAPVGVRHGVRETAQYAAALLIRDLPGDLQRACRALRRIVQFQFDEQGTVYHGTFYRYPEEPHPGQSPVIWRDYDPNWRQFIGTAFAILIDEFAGALDAELVCLMERSIQLAVIGETDRLKPSYTNIALMKAALDVWAGARFGKPEWIDRGNALSDAVFSLFQPHSTFCEYNSPTYYGVNLYALQCWKRSSSHLLRERGAIMEAELWRDIGRFYHAGMRNLCGPFDRAYGMNMQNYAALIGLWIWLETGEAGAPYPNLSEPFEHRHDFCAAGMIALLGTTIPEEVKPHLHAFQQPRQVERTIETDRVATAWLENRVMFGGQRGNAAVSNQYHPATVHWITSDGVGTVHLEHQSSIDAIADRTGIAIAGRSTQQPSSCRLIIQPPRSSPFSWKTGILTLPGLSLSIETDLEPPEHIGNALLFQILASRAWHINIRLQSVQI